MSKKKSLSIIIPNYNGKSLLQEYLPYTLIAAKKALVPYEIIVIDDSSNDGSVAFIEENYPEIVLIKNSVNKGFSYSCNQGMNASKYELLFFLNSDVKLTPDYFDNQWKYFEKEDTFGVMGKILEMDSNKIEVAARFFSNVGFKFKTNKLFYHQEKSGFFIPTAFLSGANALVDAEKIKLLGGFDEIFSPYYGEDLDLGLRAWRLGWKCYYDHHSTCYHRGSFTTKTQCKKSWVKKIYFRNRFMVHAIHLDGFNLSLWYFQVFFLEVIPKLLIGQHWYLYSYISFLKQKKEISTSKQRFTFLMKKKNSTISVFDIQKKVTTAVPKEKIVWL